MFQLAHLSDLHLGPLPRARVAELFNKRLSGYLSWHLTRRKIHTPLALQRVVDDIRAHEPDHVALTGDLVNIGLSIEYEHACRWLEQFGPPSWITIVPGNHDAYIADTWRQGVGKWRSYFTGDMRVTDDPSGDEDLQFPFVRLRRYVALIGVSSAIATGVGRAWGELGERQIEALRPALAETRRRGFYRVLLIHHPPLAGLCPPRKALIDAMCCCLSWNPKGPSSCFSATIMSIITSSWRRRTDPFTCSVFPRPRFGPLPARPQHGILWYPPAGAILVDGCRYPGSRWQIRKHDHSIYDAPGASAHDGGGVQ